MSAFNSSQKLWRVIKERDDYYYEIRLAGIIVDRVKVDEPALKYLKSKEVLEKEPPLYMRP
jgi:hypothetical protein